MGDLGGGKPNVIIADIYATAGLVRAAAAAHPGEFYHSSKLLLYLDEPNMGIHLDGQVGRLIGGRLIDGRLGPLMGAHLGGRAGGRMG